MKQALRLISTVVLLSCVWLAVLDRVSARADTPAPRFEAQKIDDISIGYGVAAGLAATRGAPVDYPLGGTRLPALR